MLFLKDTEEDGYKIWLLLSGCKTANRLLLDNLSEYSSRRLQLGILGREYLFKGLIQKGMNYHNSGDLNKMTPQVMLDNKSDLMCLRLRLLEIAKSRLSEELVNRVCKKKLAVVQIRCDRHHSIRTSWASKERLSLRNADADIFVDGIKMLLENGYTVVRSGLFVSKRLSLNSPEYIEVSDYNEELAEALTILIMLESSIILSTASGPDGLAVLNPKCVLGLVCQTQFHRSIAAWQQVFQFPTILKGNRELSINEIVDLCPLDTDNDVEEQGLTIIKTSEHVIEMVKYLLLENNQEESRAGYEELTDDELLRKMRKAGNVFAESNWMSVVS